MSQDCTTPPKTNEERLKHTADSLYQSYLKTIELINSNVGSTYLPSEKIDTDEDVSEDLITIAQDSIMYAITGRVLSITEDLGFDEETKDILNNEVQNQIHRIERLFGYTRGSWGLEVADSPPS